MKKNLTTRAKLVLIHITQNPNNDLLSIANMLEVSTRQIRYDIECINEYYNINITTDNKGNIFVGNISEIHKCIQKIDENIKFSKEERVNYLLIMLAYNLDCLNINEYGRRLNTSRVTIKNDLEEVKNILMKKYHLRLEYDLKYKLVGQEKHLFIFREETLSILEKFNCAPFNTNYNFYFDKNLIAPALVDIVQTKIIVKEFMNQVDLYCNDDYFKCIAYSIIMTLWYCKHKLKLPKELTEGRENEIILDIDFKQLYDKLEAHYQFALDDISKWHISSIISSFFLAVDKKESSIIEKVITYIYHLIVYLNEECGISLFNDFELLKALFHHLAALSKRKSKDLDVPTIEQYAIPLDKKIKDRISEFCLKNVDIICVNTVQEIALIQLYVANSLRKNQNYKRKYQIMLVSGCSSYQKTH